MYVERAIGAIVRAIRGASDELGGPWPAVFPLVRVLALVALFGGAAGMDAGPEIKYAKNFEIADFDTHRLITVRNTWIGAGDASQVYALVPREAALPELPQRAVTVRVPVQRLVLMDTVFLGPVEDLALHDTLVGIAHPEFSHDEIAQERIASGQAKAVQTGSAMDIESMLLLKPDLILTSTTGNPTFDIHPHMLRAGLPVAVTAGYMESHPLARAEWIKFLAAFFDKDAEAAEAFDQVAQRYESLARLAASAEKRPTVFSGAPYGGVWHVPGGKSYTARAFVDAGADYLWSDNESRGGVPVDVETILHKASDADFWLHPSHYDSLRALLSADERFIGFDAAREKHVFNNSVRVNEHGGNDIFERGVSHPDEVLADLIKIFHPQFLPEHSFVFYERLQ